MPTPTDKGALKFALVTHRTETALMARQDGLAIREPLITAGYYPIPGTQPLTDIDPETSAGTWIHPCFADLGAGANHVDEMALLFSHESVSAYNDGRPFIRWLEVDETEHARSDVQFGIVDGHVHGKGASVGQRFRQNGRDGT